jgi:hypothetical protein
MVKALSNGEDMRIYTEKLEEELQLTVRDSVYDCIQKQNCYLNPIPP